MISSSLDWTTSMETKLIRQQQQEVLNMHFIDSMQVSDDYSCSSSKCYHEKRKFSNEGS